MRLITVTLIGLAILFLGMGARINPVGGAYSPLNVSVVQGSLFSGGLEELYVSDDERVVVQSVLGAGGQYATVECDFYLPDSVGPAGAQLQIERSVNSSQGGPSLLVFAWNWNTNTFVNVKALSLPTTDSLGVYDMTQAQAANYVSPNGNVRFMLRAINPTKLGFPPPPQIHFKIDYCGFGPLSSPPSNLVASVISDERIELAWADNSFDEQGFRIERKGGVSGSSFMHIADVPSNTVSWSAPNKTTHSKLETPTS